MSHRNEDQELWEKLRQKDEAALKSLFFKFNEKLVNRAYHLINNKEAAEELTQDLFLTIWEKASSIELKGKIENYLLVSIKNRSFNYLKSRFANTYLTIHEEDSEVEFQTHEYDLKQLNKKVIWAINQLPAKCKEIFILSRRHEMTYNEISKSLGISKKTVETQMGIALKKLRELIK
ncbi:MAG: RNA polymerase sigma-70 factor [Ekhidna sp.]|nr:RNA polymerase sigma-70 factor [Ekhidna sp.]